MTQERDADQDSKRVSSLVKPTWDVKQAPKPDFVDVSEQSTWDLVRASLIGGWRLFMRRTSLVFWAGLSEGLITLLSLAPWLILLAGALSAVGPLLIGFEGLETPVGLARGLRVAETFLSWVTAPRVVLGGVGLFVTARAGAFFVRILVESGVMGVCAPLVVEKTWDEETSEDTTRPQEGFWTHIGARIGGLFCLRTLGAIAFAASTLLTAALGVGALRVVEAVGWIGEGTSPASAVASSCVVALCASLGCAVCGVVWVIFEQATAALYTEPEALWSDVLWEATERVGLYTTEVLGLGATISLVYGGWVCAYLLLGGIARTVEQLSSATGGILTLSLDIVSAFVFAAVWIWGRGAWSTYVALRAGKAQALPRKAYDTSSTVHKDSAYTAVLLPTPEGATARDVPRSEEGEPDVFTAGEPLIPQRTQRSVVSWAAIQERLGRTDPDDAEM